MSANIYLEDLQVTTSITEYSYSFRAFLEEIGGNMGLFVSVTLIMSFEIVVVLLDERMCVCITKKCEKKVNDGLKFLKF